MATSEDFLQSIYVGLERIQNILEGESLNKVLNQIDIYVWEAIDDFEWEVA